MPKGKITTVLQAETHAVNQTICHSSVVMCRPRFTWKIDSHVNGGERFRIAFGAAEPTNLANALDGHD